MANPGTIHGTHHLTFCVGTPAGGLRLPRPDARAQEHQEDRPVRRRAAGLPPLLRQPGGRREHGPDELPVPARRLDGQARDEPAQADQPVRAGGLDRLLGGPAGRARASRPRAASCSAPSACTSPIPCGIPYAMVGETEPDDREPWDDGGVPGEHAIRGAYGTTTSVREPEPMDFFLREAFNCTLGASEGGNHQYELAGGYGRKLELVEEPDLPQGSWNFGEGTIHHHAFDAGTAENQAAVKDYIVGLGFTDVSDVKDRGYFFSVYMRTPGGALFELALRDRAWLHDRRDRGRARHPHVHPAALGGPPAGDRAAREDRHGRDGGRLTGQARVAAVLMHGRDQDPAYMQASLGRAPGARRRGVRDARRATAGRGTRGGSSIRWSPWSRGWGTLWRRWTTPWRHATCRCRTSCWSGFSQGACVVAEHVARRPAPYRGVALLTGCLIGRPEEHTPIGDVDGLPVFVSARAAGRVDPVGGDRDHGARVLGGGGSGVRGADRQHRPRDHCGGRGRRARAAAIRAATTSGRSMIWRQVKRRTA